MVVDDVARERERAPLPLTFRGLGNASWEARPGYPSAVSSPSHAFPGRGDLGGNPVDRWFRFALEPMLAASFEKGLADLERVVIAARTESD